MLEDILTASWNIYNMLEEIHMHYVDVHYIIMHSYCIMNKFMTL